MNGRDLNGLKTGIFGKKTGGLTPKREVIPLTGLSANSIGRLVGCPKILLSPM